MSTIPDPIVIQDTLPEMVAEMACRMFLEDSRQGRIPAPPFQYARAAYDLALAAAWVTAEATPGGRQVLGEARSLTAGVHYPSGQR